MGCGDAPAEAKIEKALSLLERDAFRCDGVVPYDRVLALVQKLGLSADDLVALRKRLLLLEIAISGDPFGAKDGDDPNSDSEDRRDESTSEPPEASESSVDRDVVTTYFAETGEIDLLTPHEELELMRRIRAGEMAIARLREGHADSDDILSSISADGEKARRAFIEANLRLVIAMAKRMPRSLMEFEDLIQEGNLGLLRAVEKFDHTRGLRFSTYASWWIWSNMQRAIADRGYLVRVPVHLRDRLQKLKRLERNLAKENNGESPCDFTLADHLGWAPESVRFLRDLDLRPVSLDGGVHSDDQGTLGDRIASTNAKNPEKVAEYNEILDAVADAIQGLKDREKLVLRMRYGLEDGEDYTLEQVGAKMGVTRERARQIQEAALDRLRHPGRSNAIRELIGTHATADRSVERESSEGHNE